jgi:catechol 2,3-dioxygenase-like lactoylglutathione lyase family enzyme
LSPPVDAGDVHPERFFHVAIKTDDLESSVAFYREALGGTVVDEGDDEVSYVAMEVGDKRIYCFDRAPYEAEGLSKELPTGVLHFGFVVDDADAAFEELVDAPGAEPLMEPATYAGLRVAFVDAPSGERVELIEER